MIKLKNYSSTVSVEALRDELEEILPEEIKTRLPEIEIWERWKDAHPSFLERIIMKLRWGRRERHLEECTGETCGRTTIRLFSGAFQGDLSRTLHIALHEIGHFLDSQHKDQNQRERAADNFAERWMDKFLGRSGTTSRS